MITIIKIWSKKKKWSAKIGQIIFVTRLNNFLYIELLNYIICTFFWQKFFYYFYSWSLFQKNSLIIWDLFYFRDLKWFTTRILFSYLFIYLFIYLFKYFLVFIICISNVIIFLMIISVLRIVFLYFLQNWNFSETTKFKIPKFHLSCSSYGL